VKKPDGKAQQPKLLPVLLQLPGAMQHTSFAMHVYCVQNHPVQHTVIALHGCQYCWLNSKSFSCREVQSTPRAEKKFGELAETPYALCVPPTDREDVAQCGISKEWQPFRNTLLWWPPIPLIYATLCHYPRTAKTRSKRREGVVALKWYDILYDWECHTRW